MAEHFQKTKIDTLPKLYAGFSDYQTVFQDVFDSFRDDESEISQYEGWFGKDAYRIQEDRDRGIILDYVWFDSEHDRHYRPVLKVAFSESQQQELFFIGNPDQLPHDAVITPELVLRSLLHNLQQRSYVKERICSRAQEGGY